MIKIKNLILDYPLSQNDDVSLKNTLISLIKRTQSPSLHYYRALSGINLCISKNERVGLIGLNGAGKSTLLRVISGIYLPTSGEVSVIGKVSPLLDFATGFELHHTGIENIRIRLMFLGEGKDSIDAKISDIADFADIGDFLHLPARTYSTGMFMRLAFATSTAINPEILVADEVVGAGDIQFADKAKDRLSKLLSGQQTTIISSHSMDLIRQFCNRVIWLHKGTIIDDGPTNSVIDNYSNNYDKIAQFINE